MKGFNKYLLKLSKVSLVFFLIASLVNVSSYGVNAEDVINLNPVTEEVSLDSITEDVEEEDSTIKEQDVENEESVDIEEQITAVDTDETKKVENEDVEKENNNTDPNKTRGSPATFSTRAMWQRIPLRVNAPKGFDKEFYIVLADEIDYVWWKEYDEITNVDKVQFNRNTTIQYIKQNTWDTRAYLLEIKDRQKYTNNLDTNVYNVYPDGSVIDFKYQVKMNYDSNTGGWNIDIVEFGNKTTSLNAIKDMMGDVTNFAVVADEFTIDGHIEGNVAANHMTNGGELQNTNNVVKKTKKLIIDVNKTVTPSLDKKATFRFGLYKNNNLVEIKEITTKFKGSTQFIVENKDGLSNSDVYQVFELDAKGNKIQNGGKLGQYTVSYDSGSDADSFDSIMGSSNVSYVGTVNGELKGLPGTASLVTTEKDAENWYGFVKVDIVSKQEFKEIMPIQKHLDNITNLSKTLAKAKTGNGVRVYNIPAPDLLYKSVALTGYVDAKEVKDYEVAVLNVIIPSDQKQVTISPNELYLKAVSGNRYNIYNGGSWADIASKIIWNYVDENGNPYTGTVDNSGQMIGTMLLPKGTLYVGGSAADAIVGKKVVQRNEIHKVPFDQTGEREVTINCTNTRPADGEVFGSLMINKTSKNATTPDNALFVVLDEDRNEVASITYKDVKAGKKIENLVLGTYTVEERNADVYGYTVNITGNKTVTLTEISPDGVVNLVNEYTEMLGKLTIEKVSKGAATPAGTEFIVTGPDNYKKVVKYSEFTNGEYTIENLKPGTYKVTEGNAEVTGYELTVTGNNKAVMVIGNTGVLVTITNTYKEILGSLTIEKVSKGAATPAGTEFTVTGPDNYKKVVKYSEFTNGKYTIENLKPGTYKVTEGNAEVAGYELTVTGNNVDVKVEGNKTATAAITNTYKEILGSLTIEKVSKGAATPAGTEFIVTGPENYKKVVKYSEFTNGKYTIENLKPGTYKVTEGNAEVAGYELTVTGNNVDVKVEGNKTTTATITNTYDEIVVEVLGSMTIRKLTFGGETPVDATFKVEGPDGYNATIKFAEFVDGAYTFDDLKPGTYKVTEENAEIEGYSLVVTGNEVEIEVVGNAVATAAITNTYTENEVFGSLTITKVSNGTTTPDETVFTITGPDGYNKVVNYKEFVDGKYVLNDLVLGEYTVTETGADVKDYTLVVEGEMTAALTKDTTDANITITNTYKPVEVEVKADVIIHKVDQDENPLPGATFRLVKLVDGEEVEIESLTNGPTFEFKDLTDGDYRVYEDEAPEGYIGLSEPFDFTVNDGEVYYEGELVAAFTVYNSNDDDFDPGVLGEEFEDEEDDDDFGDDVLGDEDENESDVLGVDTSDNSNIGLYAGLVLVAGIAVFFLTKKKKA